MVQWIRWATLSLLTVASVNCLAHPLVQEFQEGSTDNGTLELGQQLRTVFLRGSVSHKFGFSIPFQQ